MSETPQASPTETVAPPVDPLANPYREMAGRMDADAAAIPADILEALRAEGWQIDAGMQPGEMRNCLIIAGSLASQSMLQTLEYEWTPDEGGPGMHRFVADETNACVLFFARDFVADVLQPDLTRVYVESLMRDLRAAARNGEALVVRTGSVQRAPLPPEIKEREERKAAALAAEKAAKAKAAAEAKAAAAAAKAKAAEAKAAEEAKAGGAAEKAPAAGADTPAGGDSGAAAKKTPPADPEAAGGNG